MVLQCGYINRACPVCRGEQFHLFCLNGSHPLKRCTDCAFVYAENIPSSDELKRNTLLRWEALPKSHWSRWQRRMNYRRDRAFIKALLMRRRVIRTLHVGCGDGLFLSMLEKSPKFDGMGIDINPELIDRGRDRHLDVHEASLPDMKLRDQIFDFVHASDLPGALHNPELMLLEIQRVLAFGGYAFLSLPRMKNLGRVLHGAKCCDGLDEQLWHFTSKNASIFLDRLGFQIKYLKVTRDGSEIAAVVKKRPNLDWDEIPRWIGVKSETKEQKTVEIRRAA